MAVTETIEELLEGIDTSQYGRDMRQYIHKGIQKCYEEGSAGETDLVARTAIAELREQKQDKPLMISLGSISALPITQNNADIESDMVCTYWLLSNPSAQSSDWTVTTADGSVTVSGIISGTTDITLKLEPVIVIGTV